MLNEIEGIKPKPKEIFKPMPSTIPVLTVAPIKAEPLFNKDQEQTSQKGGSMSKRHIPG